LQVLLLATNICVTSETLTQNNNNIHVVVSKAAEADVTYRAGYFRATAGWPGNTWLTSNGQEDVFVMASDQEKGVLWAIRMGGPRADYVHSLETKGRILLIIDNAVLNAILANL